MEYKIQNNVGTVKYLLSYYDGIKKHKDGSPFWILHVLNQRKN